MKVVRSYFVITRCLICLSVHAFYLRCSQISIEPAEAGTYTAQLQIYSFPVVCDVQPVTHSLGPVLALEVVAEEPRVEV